MRVARSAALAAVLSTRPQCLLNIMALASVVWTNRRSVLIVAAALVALVKTMTNRNYRIAKMCWWTAVRSALLHVDRREGLSCNRAHVQVADAEQPQQRVERHLESGTPCFWCKNVKP